MMRIGGYELESPLINGGGPVKTLEDVRLMAQTGVGAVLGGSYTINPRVGNSPNGEVDYYHDEHTGITYNSKGLPNPGMDYVSDNAREMMAICHEYGKPFILNFAPVTSRPRIELRMMAGMLVRHGVDSIDAIELNASCPNVITEDGGRHELLCYDPQHLEDVLGDLKDISKEYLQVGSIFVRVSPFRKRVESDKLAQILEDLQIDAVAAFNTWPGGVPTDDRGRPILQVPGNAGGMSGPGMQMQAEAQTKKLRDAREALDGTFDIIGSNGIATGESMARRLRLGAAAVSATTAFWEARSWGDAADRLLREFAECSDIENLDDKKQ
jgi:dihydroorotate dehydrogenase